jgi:DnaJ-class molecular chaperone
MTQPDIVPTALAGEKCETCAGSGFVPKMGAVMPGEWENDAVEPCPTCDGSGLKERLGSHSSP